MHLAFDVYNVLVKLKHVAICSFHVMSHIIFGLLYTVGQLMLIQFLIFSNFGFLLKGKKLNKLGSLVWSAAIWSTWLSRKLNVLSLTVLKQTVLVQCPMSRFFCGASSFLWWEMICVIIFFNWCANPIECLKSQWV